MTEESSCVQVQFSVEKSTFHLLVDGFRVTDGHLANDEGSSLDLHNLVYLGGDPARNTKVCSKTCFTPHLETFSHMTRTLCPLHCSPGTQRFHKQHRRMYQECRNKRGSFAGTRGEPQNSTLLQHTGRDGHILRRGLRHLRFGNTSH